jgi:hypothetical protein
MISRDFFVLRKYDDDEKDSRIQLNDNGDVEEAPKKHFFFKM